MSELSLIPDPKLMVVQAGVFLTNMYIIKKLYVEPYMTLREKREKLTGGNQDSALSIVKECEEKSLKIEASLNGTYKAAKTDADKIRVQGKSNVDAIIKEASQAARAKVEAVSQEVNKMVEAEKEKIPALVSNLTNEMYSKLIN